MLFRSRPFAERDADEPVAADKKKTDEKTAQPLKGDKTKSEESDVDKRNALGKFAAPLSRDAKNSADAIALDGKTADKEPADKTLSDQVAPKMNTANQRPTERDGGKLATKDAKESPAADDVSKMPPAPQTPPPGAATRMRLTVDPTDQPTNRPTEQPTTRPLNQLTERKLANLGKQADPQGAASPQDRYREMEGQKQSLEAASKRPLPAEGKLQADAPAPPTAKAVPAPKPVAPAAPVGPTTSGLSGAPAPAVGGTPANAGGSTGPAAPDATKPDDRKPDSSKPETTKDEGENTAPANLKADLEHGETGEPRALRRAGPTPPLRVLFVFRVQPPAIAPPAATVPADSTPAAATRANEK